ncbi:MAG: acyl carrier protein [Paenalcaligenes sp.]
MITLPERPELRAALAKIIAEVCRCDEEALLKDLPFSEIIEHYDSLAMLEILLGIEARFDVTTDDMLPPEYRTQEEVADLFPKTLDELADHTYNVAARLNKEEQEKAEAAESAASTTESAELTPQAPTTEHTETAPETPAPTPRKAAKKAAKKAAGKTAKKAAKKVADAGLDPSDTPAKPKRATKAAKKSTTTATKAAKKSTPSSNS